MGAIHLIPDPDRLTESCALAEQADACFEYNDFYIPSLLDDPAALDERIRLYKGLSRDRSRDTLHGAFLDVTVHSDDPRIREVSALRVRQSLDIAGRLGLRGAVFHTGLIANFRSPAYREGWLYRNRTFWAEICEAYRPMEVFLENMFDTEPDSLAALGEAMQDVPNFGLCLDYAHAQVFGSIEDDWIGRLAPYIRHMHINDNDGFDDLHDAVGDGVIDWRRFSRRMREAGTDCSVLIETRSIEKQRRSLRFIRGNGIYPFAEGGDAVC